MPRSHVSLPTDLPLTLVPNPSGKYHGHYLNLSLSVLEGEQSGTRGPSQKTVSPTGTQSRLNWGTCSVPPPPPPAAPLLIGLTQIRKTHLN